MSDGIITLAEDMAQRGLDWKVMCKYHVTDRGPVLNMPKAIFHKPEPPENVIEIQNDMPLFDWIVAAWRWIWAWQYSGEEA